MKILVDQGFVWLIDKKPVLDILNEHYSFKNKQAETQFKRFLKTCAAKENAGRGGPGWEAWKSKTLAQLKEDLIVYAGRFSGESLVFPVGLFHSIKQTLIEYQLSYEVEDRREWDFPKRLLGKKPSYMRPYQTAAVDAAIEKRGGMLRCATGTGKTLCGQEIIRHFGFKSLFLVPSRPILEQTVRRFRESFGNKNVGVFGGGKKDPGWVTVATYQSIYASDEDWSEYPLVIGDECHHVGAETLFEVMTKKLNHAPYRIGLSADEERADGGTILVEAATGPVIFSYDAPQAIAEGYLAKPTFMIYEVNDTAGTYRTIEYSQSGEEITVENEAKPIGGNNYLAATKNWLIGNDLLHSKIAQMAQEFAASGDSVLILVDEKEQGEKLIRNLSGAEFITGGGKSNEKTIKAFNNRQLKILVATSVLGEGADTVPVNVLINLMGGTRPKQANGRALRNDPDPETGIPRKPTALIIDFDFPKSSILSRHSELRQAVHKECGAVHRSRLI